MRKDKRRRSAPAEVAPKTRTAPRWIRTNLPIGIGEYLGYEESRGAIYGFRSGYIGPVAEEHIVIASDKREEVLISPQKAVGN